MAVDLVKTHHRWFSLYNGRVCSYFAKNVLFIHHGGGRVVKWQRHGKYISIEQFGSVGFNFLIYIHFYELLAGLGHRYHYFTAIKYTKRNYDKYFQKFNQIYFAGAPYSHLPPSPSYSRTRHKTHYYPRYWSLLDYDCDHVELVEVLGDYFNVQQVINSSQVSSWKDQAFVIFCPPPLFLLNIWFNWLIWKIISDHRKIF